ncbi:hypothetical protein NDU88_005868 [Pleurodeles waltl]|uniref:Uncharacterized protein n=1 Tax=Pleurodeles waltl TaxID=8319 RepID=A0AAV7MBQ6_PLEWA|nr:hypothetical protein NDU88_005868 [Pleurodeles waltl]
MTKTPTAILSSAVDIIETIVKPIMEREQRTAANEETDTGIQNCIDKHSQMMAGLKRKSEDIQSRQRQGKSEDIQSRQRQGKSEDIQSRQRQGKSEDIQNS